MGYDPNEARDQSGRWTSSGSSIGKILRGSQRAPLTNGEKQAIQTYRDIGSAINEKLRRPDRSNNPWLNKIDFDHTVKTLDGTFNKFSLSEDIKVYRIVPESVDRMISMKPNGTLITDRAFVSTTYDPNMIKNYLNTNWDRKMIPFEIIVPKGTKANTWLDHDVDSEVLLARGTRFKIIGKNKLEVVR